MRARALFVCVVVVSLSSPLSAIPVASPAAAMEKSKGKGTKGKKAKKGKKKEAEAGAESGFSAESKRIIREWFADPGNLEGLPPGLAKRDELPPGLQKQLEKNGALPPGLQKKIQPLPLDLEARLPALPEGYRRIVIGGNVILLDETTSLIVDVIEDILS